MPNLSNEIGDRLEDKARRFWQGIRVTQSGGGKFWKLDVAAGTFLMSCKATGKDGIRITAAMMHEARRAARGAIGRGDSYRPAIVIDVDGEDEFWVAFPASVAADMLTKEPDVAFREPSKGDVKRARAYRRSLG